MVGPVRPANEELDVHPQNPLPDRAPQLGGARMTEAKAAETAPANFRRGARPTWHQRRRHGLVRQLSNGLGGTALDYGCGWGDISHLLSSQFTSVVGVDVSAARVAFAAEQYPSLSFEQCAGEGLRFDDSSFDTVLSVVVLPFVPDGDRYLAECARVLRPGGGFLFVVPNPHSNLDLVYRLAGKPPKRRARNIDSVAGLEAQLARFGFTIEARGHFFDPPFDRITNPGEVVLATLNVIGHLRRDASRASYLGYRARLAPQ